MNIEDRIFTRARLGRYWTEDAARKCAAFFGTPYQFSIDREREFMAKFKTDYNDNLKHLCKQTEQSTPA